MESQYKNPQEVNTTAQSQNGVPRVEFCCGAEPKKAFPGRAQNHNRGL